VPGLRDKIDLKRLCGECARFSWHNSLKTPVCRVPGLHFTNALIGGCAVCWIYVTIFPPKRFSTVCQAHVTQLP